MHCTPMLGSGGARAGAGSNAPRGTGEGKATLGAWV